MIQRIQSVFLALAAGLNIGSYFAPLWKYQGAGEHEFIRGLGFEAFFASNGEALTKWFWEHGTTLKTGLHGAYVGLTLLASVFLMYAIFQYGDLKRQAKLIYFASVIVMLQILSLVLLTRQAPDLLLSGADNSTAYWGFGLPIAAVICARLAIRYIRADERKIRSADRLR